MLWLLFAALSYWAWLSYGAALRALAPAAQKPAELLRLALAIGPYVLPVTCSAVSTRYAIALVRGSRPSAGSRTGTESDWIRRLGWMQFEQLVESHFAHRGMRTILLRGLPRYPARLSVVDGAGATILVHCTEWKAGEVGYEVVKAFADEIEARAAQSGQLLTFGRLTRGACSLAFANNIDIVSGDRLIKMLRSSGWESSRFRESGSGASSGFDSGRSSGLR